MGKAKNIILFLASITLSSVFAQGTPPSPEEMAQDAEAAAQKLTGGLIQIADDRRIENQITNAGKFPACQAAFQKRVKAALPGTVVELKTVLECNDIIPSKKDELADLVKNLNPSSEALNFQKDANYKAMYAYLNERLETALYGEKNNPNDKSLHLVDHKNFYTLYKSQISKKFLFDTSSYCMETFGPKSSSDDRENGVGDPGYNYKKWMEDKIKKGETKDLGKEFAACLISIPCNCYGKLDKAKYCPDKDKAGKATSLEYIDDDKVRQQACLLTARLKELKQEMIALKEIDDGYAKLDGNSGLSSKNQVSYDPTAKDKTVDDLTLIGTDDYKKATVDIETKSQEFKKNCSDPTIKLTDAKCGDLSTIDSNKYADVQLEYQLKTKALSENIDKMDKDKLEEYLKGQKKTEDEIKQLWADHQGDFDKIKKQIKDQVLTEREQIIKEIADQINQNSVITENGTALNENKSKIKKVVENQMEKTKRLIQYNNIVSAYLSTSSASGKTGHYTKGLEREIASDSGTKKDEDYFKQLKMAQKEQSKNSTDAPGGATLLDVGAIDNILGNAK